MPPTGPLTQRWWRLLREELRQLARVNRSDRPWEMPIAAALASGLPIFIGTAFGEPALGLVASLGGHAFIYLPPTQLSHRMAWLMACTFGMCGSYALGVVSHAYPALALPLLVLVTTVVTMICRFYAVAPPGSLFFVMATAIGAFSPVSGQGGLAQIGAFTLGGVLAVVIAFVYSLHIVSRRGVPEASPRSEPDWEYVVLDSIVIGGFVGLSLLIAQLLALDRPYWVPITCLGIIQSVSLRALWTRQLQRILGTAIGLLVFLAITRLPLNPWSVAALIMLLGFVIESLIVRHYGLATVFITPLTILLAEAAHLPSLHLASEELMRARWLDTLLGSLVGLAGGACLYSPRFRAAVRTGLAWLTPRQPRA